MRRRGCLLLLLLLWIFSSARARDCTISGSPVACYPSYENIAAGRVPEASNTCGLTGPERVCFQLGSRGEVAGTCTFCDASDEPLAHLPEHITDPHLDPVTFWQSQNFTIVQYPNSVNITFSFNRSFEIRDILIEFHSSRPESYTILKSTDFGQTYTPFHFFSLSCDATYGVEEGTTVEVGNEAIPLCTSEEARLTPTTGGQAIFRPLRYRPSAGNFESNPQLKEWVRATNIILELDRLNTFGDEVLTRDTEVSGWRGGGRRGGGGCSN